MKSSKTKKAEKVATTSGSVPTTSTKLIPEKTTEQKDVSGSYAVRFPIVGIGASAGGLAAFEAFFSGMPADADPGMAFVLVQHLAPDHKSILTGLIQRYTRMQVFEVTDGMDGCTQLRLYHPAGT